MAAQLLRRPQPVPVWKRTHRASHAVDILLLFFSGVDLFLLVFVPVNILRCHLRSAFIIVSYRRPPACASLHWYWWPFSVPTLRHWNAESPTDAALLAELLYCVEHYLPGSALLRASRDRSEPVRSSDLPGLQRDERLLPVGPELLLALNVRRTFDVYELVF